MEVNIGNFSSLFFYFFNVNTQILVAKLLATFTSIVLLNGPT